MVEILQSVHVEEIPNIKHIGRFAALQNMSPKSQIRIFGMRLSQKSHGPPIPSSFKLGTNASQASNSLPQSMCPELHSHLNTTQFSVVSTPPQDL